MTKWAKNSQRLVWAKDSILALFAKDTSPKTVKEVSQQLNFIPGAITVRKALDNLYREKKLFRMKGRANLFIYRLPDIDKDKWWLGDTGK